MKNEKTGGRPEKDEIGKLEEETGERVKQPKC
jgi:hypothetical protein